MQYRGRVKNGVVVLDSPRALPEGAEVRVELVSPDSQSPLLDEQGQTLGQKLMKYAGRAVDLPDDAALNHDHYLYGARSDDSVFADSFYFLSRNGGSADQASVDGRPPFRTGRLYGSLKVRSRPRKAARATFSLPPPRRNQPAKQTVPARTRASRAMRLSSSISCPGLKRGRFGPRRTNTCWPLDCGLQDRGGPKPRSQPLRRPWRRHRDDHRGRLVVDHPDGISSAMIAERVCRGIAGHGDHVEADRTDARHRFQLFEHERPRPAARGVPSSLTGMNAPLRPPTELEANRPPFLTASFSSAPAAVDPGAPTQAVPTSR